MVDKKKKAMKRVKESPTEFFTEEGKVIQYKASDFPETKEGQKDYCDYWIARWENRKKIIASRKDPLERKKARLKKLEEDAAKIRAELGEGSDA